MKFSKIHGHEIEIRLVNGHVNNHRFSAAGKLNQNSFVSTICRHKTLPLTLKNSSENSNKRKTCGFNVRKFKPYSWPFHRHKFTASKTLKNFIKTD
jgi:hypothetical protein